MKRLLTLLFFAFFAITTQAQTVPNLPPGSVPFGTGLFRDPDGDIWGGSKFDGYVNLGNWQRVADSLGAKINWSDTTLIASKEWVEGKLNSLPPSGVLTVTGDGVDNTDPANPVLSYPDPSDIGALAPGDNVSELTNDAGYLDSETDPVYSGDPASSITQNDIDAWDAKQDAITGAATTVVQNNLTPSRALISNGSGKIAVSPVSAAELAFIDGVTSNVQDQLDAKIPLAQKGASDGVAPLGPDGKVPNNYLNFTGYTPKGSWDASTNTPTLADGAGTIGWVYTVSVAGTQDLGSGSVSYNVGDRVVYTADNIWVKEENTQLVVSVNGYQGVVNLNKADVGLGNVDNTSDLDKPISNAVQDALDMKLDASEISNYYTKTNLQTSGQAQVHWGNITNTPTTLGGYGISDAIFNNYTSAGWLTNLPGGSGVDANSLPGANIFYIGGTTGNSNFPQGASVFLSLRHSAGPGAQLTIRNSDGAFRYRGVNASGEGQWYDVASEQHVTANYLGLGFNNSRTIAASSGDLDTYATSLAYITRGTATNAPSWATTDGIVLTAGTSMLSNRQLWFGRLGEVGVRGMALGTYTDDWIQLASVPWTLSQPFGAITQTDIDKWNSAFTPEDIGFGLHTDANGKLAWGTSIGGGTIGFKTDSLLFFANQAQTSGVLIGNGMTVAVDGEQTFVVTGTMVSTNPSDVFRAVAGDNTGEQVASISAGRLTDPDRAIVQARTSEGEGAFVNMSAFSGPNTDFPVKSASMSAGNVYISVTNSLSSEDKSGFVYDGNTGNSKGIMEMSNLTDGNLLINTAPGAGIILRSPNDTKYLLTVDDAGNLTTTLVP